VFSIFVLLYLFHSFYLLEVFLLGRGVIFINKKESKAIFNLLKRLLLIFLLKTTHETFKI